MQFSILVSAHGQTNNFGLFSSTRPWSNYPYLRARNTRYTRNQMLGIFAARNYVRRDTLRTSIRVRVPFRTQQRSNQPTPRPPHFPHPHPLAPCQNRLTSKDWLSRLVIIPSTSSFGNSAIPIHASSRGSVFSRRKLSSFVEIPYQCISLRKRQRTFLQIMEKQEILLSIDWSWFF